MCLSINGDYVYSAEQGQNSVIRIWKVGSLKCMNIFQSKIADIDQMRYS